MALLSLLVEVKSFDVVLANSIASSGETLATLAELDRTSLLSKLKAVGVVSLPQRQAVASAVSKALKAGLATRSNGLAELPRPGAPYAARRKKMPPLPPYKRLQQQQLRMTMHKSFPGAWYKVELPTGLEQLREWGAEWLTRAFHAAGSLDLDDAITKVVRFEELEVQGFDAQGGAGLKAILEVEYQKPDNGLHTLLFVKCPWTFEGEHGEYNRTLLSVMYGDGDGLELSTYQFLEGLLPVRIPKFYFGDISRESSMYWLITECVPFSPRPPTTASTKLDWRDTPVGQLLPKSGKYQDDRLADSHLYYCALMRAMAKIAAADKRGVFDEHIDVFHNRGVVAVAQKDTETRRSMLTRRAADAADKLIEFITKCAYNLFPPPLNTVSWLNDFKRKLLECAPYATGVGNYLNQPELFALSHVNLQIDNAFFWRESADSEQLECGLLDWYNFTRAPAVSVWGGALSGVEPEVMVDHGLEIMTAFSEAYEKYGGPKVDPNELLNMFILSLVGQTVAMCEFIEKEIYAMGPPRNEWPEITDRWDAKIMGVWQVRCRVVALLQLLKLWDSCEIHKKVMDWVAARRPAIDAL